MPPRSKAGTRDRRPGRGRPPARRRRGSPLRTGLALLAVLTVLGMVAAGAWFGYLPGPRRIPATDRAADSLLGAAAAPGPDSALATAADSAPPSTVAVGDAAGVSAADSAAGDAIYHGAVRCASCHGARGEGVARFGPSLQDEIWLHGDGSPAAIAAVVAAGASPPRGDYSMAMPSYAAQLDATQRAQVAAYIFALGHPGAVRADTAGVAPAGLDSAAPRLPGDTSPPPR